jgi:hypothetical protein
MIGKFEQKVAMFLRSEDGAVTVDWVVLTAAVVGLGLVIGSTVGQSTVDLAGSIGDEVNEVRIYSYTQSQPPGGSGG